MIEQLPSLMQLLKVLQQVPYLASKNLYKVVDHFLQMDAVKAQQFCKILLEAKQNILLCDSCFALKEVSQPCALCSSTRRDQALVCVVETWQELFAIEQTRGYNGVYHVLGGVVSPLEGIGPEDLTIEQLVNRVQQGINEIILATSQTPEGEATASYIALKLKTSPVTISCLARGLPVGSTLGGMDRLTVYKALAERRPF